MATTTSYTNTAALIEGVKQGKTDALNQVYKQHYGMILTLVQRYSTNDDDFKDIMQETVVALYQNVLSGRYSPDAKLSTYLYRIARNQCEKKLSRKGHRELPQKEEADNSNDSVVYKQRQDRVKAYLLNDLKADCRELLVMFYYQKMSLTEIANEMDFTVDYAKNKKRRCMGYFRTIVKKGEENHA